MCAGGAYPLTVPYTGMSEKIGIIDLGSNTTRLLIIEILDSGAYRVVEEAKETIRLAENMQSDGTIKPPAIDRAVTAIRIFKDICDYNRVDKVYAVATAAVRESINGKDVVDTIASEAGVTFRILSRQEEAFSGYLGVVNTLDIRNAILVDLGGGSMEITAVKDRRIMESISLPYGSVNLTERFLDTDRATESQILTLESFLKLKFDSVPWLSNYTGYEMVGIGGTIRTVAKIHQRMADYPFDHLHNYSVAADDVSGIYNKIKGMNIQDRRSVPGLPSDRADIIVAGACGANTLIKYLKAPSVRVSSRGLREGVFFEHYIKEQVVEDITSFSVDNLTGLYGVDRDHAWQVTRISLALFDRLEQLHGLGERERRMLYAASMLHEIGYFYDYRNRLNNTFYNIVNSTIFGFMHTETYKSALIAAYYGAGGIKSRNVNGMISKDELKSLKKLGVILALSDSLDRTRKGVVSAINCNVQKDTVELKLITGDDPRMELMTAVQEAPYFKKAFDRNLVITVQ